jgi:hypothetical protein
MIKTITANQKEISELQEALDDKEWSNKRTRFEEVFEHALRTKAQATVTKDLF